MDRLSQKYTQLIQALKTLEMSLAMFKILKQQGICCDKQLNYEEEYRIHRDSIIQRFEYSIDLFWKYIKIYLESKHVILKISVAGEAIKQACLSKIINEQESEQILEMLKSRNLTSHMYAEEVAEQLAADIPNYHARMLAIVEQLKPLGL